MVDDIMQVLSRMPDTSACIGHPLILPYIHRLYSLDIAPMAQQLGIDPYVYLRCSLHRRRGT